MERNSPTNVLCGINRLIFLIDDGRWSFFAFVVVVSCNVTLYNILSQYILSIKWIELKLVYRMAQRIFRPKVSSAGQSSGTMMQAQKRQPTQ